MARKPVNARFTESAFASRAARGTAVILIDFYRILVSPLLTAVLGPACRFEPTCSVYAREAIGRHGMVAGGGMMLRRLGRCRPAGGWGFDPVPDERERHLKCGGMK